MLNRIRSWFRRFFFPSPSAPRWIRLLPYVVLGLLTLMLLTASAYAWDYTNSPAFCGTTCHTMPPEYSSYQISPHARIACVECHIGREFIGNQITRKAGDIRHIVALAFTTYEFPIRAKTMRPAPEICERCHSPEKFSDDSLREVKRYGDDTANTPESTYLVLKTGGGSRRQGLGRGIHWHIENRVLFYSDDDHQQSIPYVRVYNDNGTVTEYRDIESGFDPAGLQDEDLVQMDCITCHNRITHRVRPADDAVDNALARQIIDASIPDIRRKSVEVLTASYRDNQQALAGIAGLENYYRVYYAEVYAADPERVQSAVRALQEIYSQSIFPEQKADWNTHATNVGHKDFPGCFRCHDGKHLNDEQEAIRLECNLCHSIPVVAGPEDFITDIEISRGLEPESHKHPNWIAQHRTFLDRSCKSCHDISNPGGTDNTSFCSNSACHGSAWPYAGFDAPALAEIVQAQLPTPEPEPPLPAGATFAELQPLFAASCGECHGENRAAGLSMLTYADLMAGARRGPVVVPGDPQASRLVEVQAGQHFGQFSPEALELVRLWISLGAPEQ